MSAEDNPESFARQLLDFLRALDDPTLLGYVRELYEEYPIDVSAEERSGLELVRDLIRQRASARRGFVPKSARLLHFEDLPLDAFRIPDALLDEHFTREVLSEVPEMVSRWKEMRDLFVEILPEEQAAVRGYLREATTCYLYGLPGAAAVLCRAALESAWADALARFDARLPEGLGRRIALARDKGILTRETSRIAHEIKDVGDGTIHKVICGELRARDQLRRTVEVLQHLYRAGGTQRGES